MIRNILFIFLVLQTFLLSSPFPIDSIDIDKVFSKDKEEDKHVLLFFHKDNCGFCEKMKNVTLEDSEVKNLIDTKFIFVDIGIDDEGTIHHKDFNGTKHAYAKSLGISLYPTVGFIDRNNTLVYGSIGYKDSKAFFLVLKYVESKSYQTMDLEAYKDELEFEEEE